MSLLSSHCFVKRTGEGVRRLESDRTLPGNVEKQICMHSARIRREVSFFLTGFLVQVLLLHEAYLVWVFFSDVGCTTRDLKNNRLLLMHDIESLNRNRGLKENMRHGSSS